MNEMNCKKHIMYFEQVPSDRVDFESQDQLDMRNYFIPRITITE
jgi:hypothetical protein